MRRICLFVIAVALSLASCKPAQTGPTGAAPEGAPAQPQSSPDETPKSGDLGDNLEEFQVTPSGSSASSGSKAP
ncbi:MAG: hypothetical protein HUU46_20835 [Candidatus Hydrogenedentes bacterium]|nr:hypothetical protein [Candidatus Hydrogenedentota bacterium]